MIKEEVNELEERSCGLVDKVMQKAKEIITSGITYAYWVLCLDDTRENPREIDTCATSYCISILVMYENKDSNWNSEYYKSEDINKKIQEAIRTLIRLRSNNGAWPSVISPDTLNNPIKNPSGDVAIGDNYFALTALMDADFLSEDFRYTDNIPNELKKLEGRVHYIFETIGWLMNNKAKLDRGGWYYTDTKNEDISVSVTTSTAKLSLVFSRIKDALKNNPQFNDYYITISSHIDSINKYLLKYIKSDGGIGKIPSDSQSSLLHTCMMIDAFSYSDKYLNAIKNGLNYVVNTIKCKYTYTESNKTEISDFKDVSNDDDFWGERYRLVLYNGNDITILHENFIEGVIIYTLLNVLIKCKEYKHIFKGNVSYKKIIKIIENTLKSLATLQERNYKYNGLFNCRATRSEGKRPVYASFEGYRAIRMYQSFQMQNIIQKVDEDETPLIRENCEQLMNDIKTFIFHNKNSLSEFEKNACNELKDAPSNLKNAIDNYQNQKITFDELEKVYNEFLSKWNKILGLN